MSLDFMLLNVSGANMAKTLWDKLGPLYQYKLYLLRMNDSDSIIKHINAFNIVVSQLVSIDVKISSEYKCINLLCSLEDSCDNLQCV